MERGATMTSTWAENRATVGTDLSADPGAKTEGRAAAESCRPFCLFTLRDWHQSDKSTLRPSSWSGCCGNNKPRPCDDGVALLVPRKWFPLSPPPTHYWGFWGAAFAVLLAIMAVAYYKLADKVYQDAKSAADLQHQKNRAVIEELPENAPVGGPEDSTCP
jgi:hypothetical protein